MISMKVLVTGSAGFIGFHLTMKLLEMNVEVIGYDNLNSYYDITLKRARLKLIKEKSNATKTKFNFINANLEDKIELENVFQIYKPTKVVNLAAQAGVRYSIENPSAYINSNIVGFSNILECCKVNNIEHLVYASSSSVYGGNTNLPFSEKHTVDHPVSLYAATKKSNELMAHTYSHLFGLASTGLRFFTVYGPWGRPDMALFLFTNAILAGKPIDVYNHGKMVRDFTYIDDIIESLVRIINKNASIDDKFNTKEPNPSTSWCPYRIFNIGNSRPIPLMDYISALEDSLGREAKKAFKPIQPGDVSITAADTSALEKWIDFKPNTTIKEGVQNFVEWYFDYYDILKVNNKIK